LGFHTRVVRTSENLMICLFYHYLSHTPPQDGIFTLTQYWLSLSMTFLVLS